MSENDILVEIPNQDLPELSKFLEKNAPWAPYMKAFPLTALKWRKKSGKHQNALRLFSPNNSWRKDGTLVIILRNGNEDIYIFTLDEECTNLARGLSETKRFKYDVATVFFAVHEKHTPVLKNFIREKNLKLLEEVPCFIYTIPPEKALSFSTECPSDCEIRKLSPSAAKRVNELWPHRRQNSEKYLEGLLETNGGYGIFLKDGVMAAWVLKHVFGNLAMLQTEEGFKKRGYASLITKVLAKEIASEGCYPTADIVLKNATSIKLFEKLGFSQIGICNFIIVSK